MDIRERIKLNFDDDFFKEEIRCDYEVTETMKKIWAIELDLLNELLEVCKKFDIKVSVFAGTLLGAVRHKGMIPWDDDIDVCLTRGEYEKLCSVAPHHFKHPYFFQNYKTNPQYLFGYSRLRNSLTTGYIKGYNDKKYNNGIYIDIFVLDGYIDNNKLLRKQIRKRNFYNWLASLYLQNSISKSKFKQHFKKKFLYPLANHTLCKIFDYESIAQKYINTIQLYNNALRISLMSQDIGFIQKYWCYKKDLENITYLPFESIEVPVPVNYDEILRHMYGDYMKFPPIDKRGLWHAGELFLDPEMPYNEYMGKLQ